MMSLLPVFFSLVALCFTGCVTSDSEQSMAPTMLMESRTDGSVKYEMLPVPMPDGSLIQIPVSGTPILGPDHFLRADVAEVDLGVAIRMTLSRRGQVELYQSSGFNLSRRLLLLVGTKVVGLRRIETVMNEPHYFTFALVPDSEIPELVLQINDYLEAYHSR